MSAQPHERLSLAEVEAIARAAAHERNEYISVRVDACGPYASTPERYVVAFELAGQKRSFSVPPDFGNATADSVRNTLHVAFGCVALYLCNDVGRAWRPDGGR